MRNQFMKMHEDEESDNGNERVWLQVWVWIQYMRAKFVPNQCTHPVKLIEGRDEMGS